MIRIQNPNQETPVSSRTQNQSLKDMNVLRIFKINFKRQIICASYKLPSPKIRYRQTNRPGPRVNPTRGTGIRQIPKSETKKVWTNLK